MLVLLSLFACAPAWRSEIAEVSGTAQSAVAAVRSVEESAADAAVDIEVRFRELEGRVVELETAQATVLALAPELAGYAKRLAAVEAELAAERERSADVEARLGAVEAELADLRSDVDEIDGGGGSSTAGTLAADVDTVSAGTGVATTSSWASVTTTTADVAVGDGGLLWASCSLLDASGYGAYRLRAAATDGSWSATGEAVGDGAVVLAYSGEALTLSGAWAVAPGDYRVTCEGWYAAPYDVTLVAVGL